MKKTLYIACIVLGLLGLFLGYAGAPILSMLCLCGSMGIAAWAGNAPQQQIHYHFHGDKKEQQAQLKNVMEATEQSVEMPDGRVARVRNVRTWN